MPWDLGELSDDELISYLSEFTAWANYLSVVATDESLKEEAIEDEIRFKLSVHIVEVGKTQLARAEFDASEEMAELRQRLRVQKHLRKQTEAVFENCVRSMNSCSRDLTRRTSAQPKRNIGP